MYVLSQHCRFNLYFKVIHVDGILRCSLMATELLVLWVQILLRAWMFFFCVCCVLWPVWQDGQLFWGVWMFVCVCVIACDLEISTVWIRSSSLPDYKSRGILQNIVYKLHFDMADGPIKLHGNSLTLKKVVIPVHLLSHNNGNCAGIELWSPSSANHL